jgi:hypothetical protein
VALFALRLSAIAAVLQLLNTTALHSAPLTASIAGIASGSFGGASFSSRPFSITALGDTAGAYDPDPTYTYLPVTANVVVDGVGAGTFTNVVVVVSNRSVNRGGFSDLTQNAAMVGLEDVAFANYDLTDSLGPLSGAGLRTGAYFPTTSGDFRLRSVGQVTYEITVVPEPAQPLLALPFMLIAARFRRRGA